jgi:hypothetical protein
MSYRRLLANPITSGTTALMARIDSEPHKSPVAALIGIPIAIARTVPPTNPQPVMRDQKRDKISGIRIAVRIA